MGPRHVADGVARPPVGPVARPAGGMHFLALHRHRRLQQRHVVLEADQPAQHPERSVKDAQVACVAPSPENPLLVGGHELAVPAHDLPVGADEQHRVVERARTGTVVLLVQADHRRESGSLHGASEFLGLRPRDAHRLVVEPDHRLLPATGRLGVRCSRSCSASRDRPGIPVSGVTMRSTPCRPASRIVSAYFSTLAFLFMKTGLIWAAQARRLLFFVNAGSLEGYSWLGG